MMGRMGRRWSQRLGAIVFGALLVAGGGGALAEELPLQCGSLHNHYGPFDYRTDKVKLPIVEHAHFTAAIASLTSGTTTSQVGGDIDYTLRAFPNHHRALMSMMRLAERDKKAKPAGARYTDECYLLRAEHFRPDDAVVKMLHGIFLMKKGRDREALAKLEAAKQLDERDPNLQYNLGLAYFRLNRYEEALEHAHHAYAMGFSLPGLKSMLERAGKWRDPAPEAAAAAEEKTEATVESQPPRTE